MPALPSHSGQSGIGLTEVLVAVLVLSIGILGLAALQLRALGNNGSSMSQTMAVVASYSILEALRADRTNAVAGKYDGTVTANSCASAGTTLITQQLNAWCGQLGNYLGQAATTKGTITCAGNANNSCSIAVQFDDSKGTGGSSAQQIVVQAGL
jgi:type IV pilus assembly protein PilV